MGPDVDRSGCRRDPRRRYHAAVRRPREPQRTPTCRHASEGMRLEAEAALSGVLQQGAGVITDFRAVCAVLGYLDRLAHPTSAELRTAPVRKISWPAGWRSIRGPIRPGLCLVHGAGPVPRLIAADRSVKPARGPRQSRGSGVGYPRPQASKATYRSHAKPRAETRGQFN